MQTIHFLYAVVFWAPMLCICGCGSSDGKIVVRGTVTLDGRPLEKATIAFVGGDGGQISSGSTDQEGKFSIAATAGLNKVVVNKLAPGDDGGFSMPSISTDEDESTSGLAGVEVGLGPVETTPKVKPIIDPMFTDPRTTPLQVTVEKGMGEVEFAALSP